MCKMTPEVVVVVMWRLKQCEGREISVANSIDEAFLTLRRQFWCSQGLYPTENMQLLAYTPNGFSCPYLYYHTITKLAS